MLELVKEVRSQKFVNPKIHLIYSIPKAGKTTIISQLENHLILELEPGGANYISGRVQEINEPKEFDQALELIQNSKEKVCDYLIIDTITRLDEWSEIRGTYNYMMKPQGKKFNREGDKADGNMIKHTDKRFETVHMLGQGYGYQHSRMVMIEWLDKLSFIVNSDKVSYIILLAHVKDKMIENKTGEAVEAIDLNLTGKVKSIYASRVDAIGFFSRKAGQGFLNYNNDFKVVCGGRCPHLNGNIKISERLEDNSIKTFWDSIYLSK